jgi:hypothetical protein
MSFFYQSIQSYQSFINPYNHINLLSIHTIMSFFYQSIQSCHSFIYPYNHVILLSIHTIMSFFYQSIQSCHSFFLCKYNNRCGNIEIYRLSLGKFSVKNLLVCTKSFLFLMFFFQLIIIMTEKGFLSYLYTDI